jgi:pantoate--beta-alanine ligase
VQIQTKKGSAPFSVVRKECYDLLRARSFEPEYVALADARTLQQVDTYENDRALVALIAAKIGGVRLIDNVVLE